MKWAWSSKSVECMQEDTVQEVERMSKLLSAASSGDVDLFWAAAMQMPDKGDGKNETTEERGRTALHFAAQAGHTQLCKYLLQNLQFNVNAQDKNGDTALTLAAAAGQDEIVDMLLHYGADPKLYKAGGTGPLHRAAGAGSASVVRRLLRAGADVNAPSESGPPLFWAAGSGHADVVLQLLRAGADANLVSQQGMTPLAMAAAVGKADVVRALLSSGASVDAVVQGGFTALHIAAESGSSQMVDLLLKAGATPNIKDDEGKTPMRVAGERGYTDLAALLARCSLGTVEDAAAAEAESSGGDQRSGSEEDEASSYEEEGEEGEEEGDMDENGSEEDEAAAAAEAGQPAAGAAAGSGAVPEGSNEAAAEMFREKATEFFMAGDFAGAVQLYTLAIQHCTRSPLLWGNRSAAHMKVGDNELALQDARAARTIDPSYAKGWYREGLAAAALGRWGDAAAAYTELARLRPGEDVAALLRDAQERAAAAAGATGLAAS